MPTAITSSQAAEKSRSRASAARRATGLVSETSLLLTAVREYIFDVREWHRLASIATLAGNTTCSYARSLVDEAAAPSPATSRAPLLEPLRALIVRPEFADRVISGPYDAYTAGERQAIAASEPLSFLNVTRSPEDVGDPGDGTGGSDITQLVDGARRALLTLLDAGAYHESSEPALYLYRLSYESHSQTGVAGLVPVDGFLDDRIRHHEDVRPERAELLAHHMLATGATSSPIALSYRADPRVDDAVAALTAGRPIVDHEQDGVAQHAWAVTGAEAAALSALIGDRALYITDGHHRAASAIRARDLVRRGEASVGAAETRALDRAFAVLFPDDQLRVLAFHRLVRDGADRSADQLITDLEVSGIGVREVDAALGFNPGPGTVGGYRRGRWFLIDLARSERPIPNDGDADAGRALDGLDVEQLERQVLAPVFAVGRTDRDAIEYLPAASGVERFVERCDAADLVGLTMHRTTTAELFAVADEGDLMPPKSSYFAPKPRSGVFLRSLGMGPMAPYGVS